MVYWDGPLGGCVMVDGNMRGAGSRSV